MYQRLLSQTLEHMQKIILITLSLLLFSQLVLAQEDDQGKITVEITKEINGEKKTFKGEYENVEQMKADPNYREFAGDENDFSFWFDKDGENDMFLQFDQLDNFSKSFNFGFNWDDDEEGHHMFKHFQFDDEDGSGFLQLDDMDLEEYRDHMKKLGVDMQELIERIHEEGDDHKVFVIKKRIKVTDVEEGDFGKQGDVSKNNRLELEDLSFYPNPSSDGRFKVRFRVPEEDELNIKVYNIDGKEVFNRYFEKFGGVYSESIDLSGQKEGMYLLEISQGNKRLTKKVVIN